MRPGANVGERPSWNGPGQPGLTASSDRRRDMSGLLSEAARKQAMAGLTGWKETADGKALERTFKFRDFNEAFGFMARAALIAELGDHNPDWRNVFKTVVVC